MVFAPGCVNYKKGALDSQSQVIKFTSCLPMVGGSPASSMTKTGRHDIAESCVKNQNSKFLYIYVPWSCTRNHSGVMTIFCPTIHMANKYISRVLSWFWKYTYSQ